MKNSDDLPKAIQAVRAAQRRERRPRSYQVVIELPNPPKLITAAVTFNSREEAAAWGRLAVDVMNCFVYVDTWRIVESQEPATHSPGRANRRAWRFV
jgi:hypothetical protein